MSSSSIAFCLFVYSIISYLIHWNKCYYNISLNEVYLCVLFKLMFQLLMMKVFVQDFYCLFLEQATLKQINPIKLIKFLFLTCFPILLSHILAYFYIIQVIAIVLLNCSNPSFVSRSPFSYHNRAFRLGW